MNFQISIKKVFFLILIALILGLIFDEARSRLYGGKSLKIDDSFFDKSLYLYSLGVKKNPLDGKQHLAFYRAELTQHEKKILFSLLKKAKTRKRSFFSFLFQFSTIPSVRNTYRLSFSEKSEDWSLVFDPYGHLIGTVRLRTVDEIRLTLLIFSVSQRYEILRLLVDS